MFIMANMFSFPHIHISVTLFQAALFGKSFIPEMNPEPCKKTIFTLRVLNAVRDYRVGELGAIWVLLLLSWGTFILVSADILLSLPSVDSSDDCRMYVGLINVIPETAACVILDCDEQAASTSTFFLLCPVSYLLSFLPPPLSHVLSSVLSHIFYLFFHLLFSCTPSPPPLLYVLSLILCLLLLLMASLPQASPSPGVSWSTSPCQCCLTGWSTDASSLWHYKLPPSSRSLRLMAPQGSWLTGLVSRWGKNSCSV